MGHLNVQHPKTKMWRCFSTVVDDWLCDWMSEDDYKEWLIKDTVESMREEFARSGIKSSKFYTYNELAFEAARTKWREEHCDRCDTCVSDYENCFLHTNDWASYAKKFADNDVLGIIPELVIPKGE